MKSVRKMAVVAAAGLMAVALTGGCSGSGGGSSTGTMKKDDVELMIRTDAAIATNIAAWAVTCPSDFTGKVGTTMTCTMVNTQSGGGTGRSFPITITITKIDSKGGVHFSEKGIPGASN